MQNTKLLILCCLLIIICGLGFLLLGLHQSNGLPAPSVSTATISQEATSEADPVNTSLVTKVIDGDTIEIEGGEKVRLIGVDTPETVDPKKSVGCFGKEASNKNKQLVEGKKVILESDSEDMDRYGRLLRYVYLPLENGQALFIDDFLIREGYGKLLIIPPKSWRFATNAAVRITGITEA